MVATVQLHRWDGADTSLPGRALTWMKTADGDVAVACAVGHIAFLHPDHHIQDDGTIRPSLGCPDEDCTWHVFGQLIGWEP